MEITQELVKELFGYHSDGHLIWKKLAIKNQIKIGSVAGHVNKAQGYYMVGIKNKEYKVSRIIFLYHNGWLPRIVDHKDRDVSNNKIENLRPATDTQNSSNRTSAKGSSSQYLGVSWYKYTNRWFASISSNHKVTRLGYFFCEKQAALAYNRMAVKLHGEFANLNIIQP